MPIDTVEELRDHLALAVKVELTTIPPYLYALYSIEDPQSDAALLIRSIVVEEMLHVCLASNLLLAVGGEPRFADAQTAPTYPCDLPHHKPRLPVNLARCSEQLVRETLMVIEQPELHGAPVEPDEYETLGQFYFAIEQAIDRLDGSGKLFADPQAGRQLGDPSFYAPVDFDAEDSGGLVLVTDDASADAAIEVIVHQGEGLSDERWADPGHQELTHYYKLEQIADGTSPIGAVRPAVMNPRTVDFPDEVRPVSELFNALFRYSLLTLDEIFQERGDKPLLVDRLYALMLGALSPVGRYLMGVPIGEGEVAGPTFEVYEFAGEPLVELCELASAVSAAHPSLEPVSTMLASWQVDAA